MKNNKHLKDIFCFHGQKIKWIFRAIILYVYIFNEIIMYIYFWSIKFEKYHLFIFNQNPNKI